MRELEPSSGSVHEESPSQFDLLVALARSWKTLLLVPLAAGGIAVGATYLVQPTFTARTSLLPPQQQSAAASALASLGALASVAGGAAGVRTQGDQIVSLMQSTTVQDRMVDRFDLIKRYETKLRSDARRMLADNSRISLNKRDGIISVEVDDESPQQAADMANTYIDELRRLSSTLAITEAQARRNFFERQLAQTRDKLIAAQVALQASGFNSGALKSEPKAAAEAFARLRAEVTVAEVRLQSLRSSLIDTAPEVMQQQAVLTALRTQVKKMESETDKEVSTDYIGRYRDFKYQETLLELFARQYELARIDEAREGALIQVVDVATPPDRKSKPKRALIGVGATVIAIIVLMSWIIGSEALRRLSSHPDGSLRLYRIRRALSGN